MMGKQPSFGMSSTNTRNALVVCLLVPILWFALSSLPSSGDQTAGFGVTTRSLAAIPDFASYEPPEDGKSKLPHQPNQCGVPVDDAKFQKYLEYVDNITGTVDGNIHAKVVRSISKLQAGRCIKGSVGEIGVHRGRFFYAMASTAAADEKLVLADVFYNRELNDVAIPPRPFNAPNPADQPPSFLQHGNALGYTGDYFIGLEGNSHSLTSADFANKGVPAFRLFSVDGDPSSQGALVDMELTSQMLHDYGVVMVGNARWLAVTDGVMKFMHTTRSDMVPFLMTCNKIYLVRRSAHPVYYEMVKNDPCIKCTQGHDNMFKVNGALVCIHEGSCNCNV